MELLENRIIKDGKIITNDVLKVDSFLNQQIDIDLLKSIGKEIYDLYKNEGVTKILTIEASGVAIAVASAQEFNVPVVFAKKNSSSTKAGNVYRSTVRSYTHGNTYDAIVYADYINKEDRVLIVDDFLASNQALSGLISIVEQAGATMVGCAVAIEKWYQGGGDKLRESGIRVDSLAKIESMDTQKGITFKK